MKPAHDTPGGLSPRAERLWRQLAGRRAKSPGRLALLEVALLALSRAEEARALIATEGLTSTSERSKIVHVHPATKVEKDALGTFTAAWKMLGLEWDYQTDGRVSDDDEDGEEDA